ncbi:hypothetical protein PSYAE_25710, partial [Pseudomonas amygdali pv. aesculi str. 0893_23]
CQAKSGHVAQPRCGEVPGFAANRRDLEEKTIEVCEGVRRRWYSPSAIFVLFGKKHHCQFTVTFITLKQIS